MILNVLMNDEWRYAETWTEMQALIAETVDGLVPETMRSFYDPGNDAWFMFSNLRHHGGRSMPSNFLRVSINRNTGYGGLIWFVTKNFPAEGRVFDSVWVSDNPNPPAFDPRVVSDPGEPLFHDRRSVLPMPRIRTAIDEFCRAGTGVRPEGVDWARGHANGLRLDVE